MGISIGSGIGGSGIGSSGIGGSGISGSSFSPLDLFANGELGSVFEADAIVSADGSLLPAWDGLANSKILAQAISGAQPTYRLRSDGVPYVDFVPGKTLSDGIVTNGYWNFLHDGTGGTLLVFAEPAANDTAMEFVRTASSSIQTGFSLSITATRAYNFQVYAAGSTVFTLAPTAGTQLGTVSGAQRFVRCSYKNDGGASDARLGIDSCRTSTSAFNAASAVAPSSANHAIPLSIRGCTAKIYAMLAISRVLTDDEVTAVYNRWRAKFGYQVPQVDLRLLVGGQSNALGAAPVNGAPTPEASQVGVYIYDKAEEYRLCYEPSGNILNQPVATVPGSNLGTPGRSWLTALGKALNDDAGQDVLLVPCAVGSTTMANWAKPATKRDRTTLFGAMDYRNSVTASKGGTPVFVWFGHESNEALVVPDYTNGAINSDYQTQWDALVANLRTEIADAPIVYCQLSANSTDALATDNALVGEAQRQFELTDANAFMVVTHDVARVTGDEIHLSAAGQAVVAERISLAIREHILGEAVNGTGPRIVSASYSGDTITLVCDKALNTTAGNYGGLFRVYDNGAEATVSSANRGTDTSTIEIVCSAALSGPVALTYGHKAGGASGAARTDFVADADGLPLPVFGPYAVPPA